MRKNIDKKKMLAIAVVILLILITVGTTAAIRHSASLKEKNQSGEAESTGVTEPMTEATTEAESAKETESLNESKESESVTESETSEKATFERTEDTPTTSSSKTDQKPANPGKTDKPAQTKPEAVKISFPYEIPGTGLVIERVSKYQGIFLEDGSDSKIDDVAAIVVRNKGSVDVEYAKINLAMGSKSYNFVLTDILAGAQIVGQESSKAKNPKGDFDSCKVDIAENKLEQSSSQVKVTELEDGSLEVKNLTGSKIPCVRVFYKFYLSDEKAYLGGITYTAKLVDLEANGTQVVLPEHYVAGYSKVVMVRTYNSAD